MKCIICNNSEFKKVFNLYDDRYGEPNLYSIKECIKCRHLCTFPRIKNEELSDLYGNYYPRKSINIEAIVNEAKKECSRFSSFLRWLTGSNNQGQFYAQKDDFFLDVGCGSGVSLLEAKYLGANPYGLEADPNVKRIAKNLNLRIFNGNLEDSPFKKIFFDLIVLNQVIEHIPEPDLLLQKLRNNLTKKGLIIISIPNVNSFWRFLFREKWINWHVPYHLHHFNKKNFIKMIDKCGLKIIKSRSITPNIWTLMQIRTLIKTNKIREKNNQWISNKKSYFISGNKKKLTNKLKIILKILILIPITILNRSFDILGLGDSFIFFIKLKS